MKTIYKLIIKDCIRFANDKTAMILTFIVPLAMIVIFGNIFGGSGGPRGKSALILVDESNSVLSRLIEQKLDSSNAVYPVKTYVAENSSDTLKFDEDSAKEWVRTGRISAAVIMPKDFFNDTSTAIKFKFYYDPKNEIESSIIQGNMQQIIMTQVPRVFPLIMRRKAVQLLGSDSTKQFFSGMSGIFSAYFKVDADSFLNVFTKLDSASLFQSSADTSDEVSFMNDLVKFESEQLVGKKITNPGLTRTIGGWAIMFLLFSLTGAATSMFEEKQEGTLKRMLSMPVTRSQVLWSKYIYSIMLGIIQLFVLFIFSWLLFDVEIFSNFFNLFIVILASASAAVSFGMLITSMAKTLQQASGYSTLIILIMSALGGSWFPVTFLPEWMQYLAKATLTYWSVEAFLQILWRQADLAAVSTHLLVLFSIAVLINAYALQRFKRGLL